MNFMTFYKTVGIRKTADMAKPKIVLSNTIKFPTLSSIYYLGNPSSIRPPKSFTNILTKQLKTALYTVNSYHSPVGDVKKLNKKVDSIIRDMKSLDDGHKYIHSKTKLLMTRPSTLTILTYSALPFLYKYKHTPTANYDLNYNSLSTMCTDISIKLLLGRINYIEIKVPDKFPKLKDFEKALTYSNKKVSTIFDNFELLTIFQLYKWLSPKHNVGSPFNKLIDDVLDTTVFMFTTGSKTSFIKASNLKSMVKDYKLETTMSPISDKSARKLFIFFVLHNIVIPGLDVNDLDKVESVYKNLTYEVNSDNINELLDDIDSKVDEVQSGMTIDEEVDIISDSITLDDEFTTLDEIVATDSNLYTSARSLLKDSFADGDITEKDLDRQLSILEEQEKSGVLKNSTVTMADIKMSPDDNAISDSYVITDKSMLKNTIETFDKKYITEIMDKDTTNVIYSIQSSGLSIKEHTVEENVDFLGHTNKHSITIQPLTGRAIKLTTIMPVVSESGKFKYGGHEYTMRKQKTDVPIKKIDATTVTLSSYYGKSFITKATYKKNDTGYAISKQLSKMNTDDNHSLKLLVLGIQTVIDKTLPLEYSQVSRYVKSFTLDGISFTFTYNNRDSLLKDNDSISDIEKKDTVLIGRKSNSYYVVNIDNKVLKVTDGKVEELDSLFNILNIDIQRLPIEFSAIRIMKMKLPTVLLFIYYVGLKNLIKMLNVTVITIERNKRYSLTDDEYRVNFKDVSIILNKTDKLGTMILAGLLDLKDIVSSMDMSHLNNKDGAVSIMTSMELSRRYPIEIKMLRAMFVDPMTAQLLEEMNEPTTWIGLLKRSNELLLTDYAEHPRNMKGMVIKGFERINGMLYKELITSVKDYENKRGLVQAKLSMNPYAVLTRLQTDSTTMLVDDLNPIGMLKQKEEVTSLGLGGRNKETMSKETRGHHPSEVGVISEAGKDSSDVGITNYLSSSPILTSLRGLAGSDNDSEIYQPSSMLSTTALILPSSIRDDAKRLSFSSIQQGHVVPIVNQVTLPVRTGGEMMIASKVDDKYVKSAKADGVIKKITDTKVIIQYVDGTTDEALLNEWTSKEEGGTTYLHKKVTTLKVRDKIKAGDTITYDKMFFEPDIFEDNKVVLKTGILLNTMLIEIEGTHEDAVSISESTVDKMKMKTVKTKSYILPVVSDIINLVKIGDVVDYDTELFTIIDNEDEDIDTSALTPDTIKILSEIKNKSPLSKVKGKVVKIQLLYNADLNDMSKTMRKESRSSDVRLFESTGKDITGKVSTGYSVNGKSLSDGFVEIKIYIDTVDKMGLADKMILGNQLKCVVSDIFENTVTENNQPVEAKFSRRAISARIVNSPDVIGTTTSALKKLTENVIDMYFE